ncbi:MAG: helix-turn-helix transcriptional regulator [Bacteroidales bacterium]|nr:helix-turn-helix transcriptional regulator [Bacteroidales bacterium]
MSSFHKLIPPVSCFLFRSELSRGVSVESVLFIVHHLNIRYISEIADILGFSDAAYFSRLFKQKTGIPPKEYSAQFIK